MVHARCCTSYPKWPCFKHEANMWYLCCMTSFCSKTFYFLLLSLIISVVTTPSDVSVWLITFNPNSRVLKIEKWKINWRENKMRKKIKKKLSPHSLILTLCWVKGTLLYWVTQENSIEFLLQSSLSYIPFGDGLC